jgi:hypothetical protein
MGTSRLAPQSRARIHYFLSKEFKFSFPFNSTFIELAYLLVVVFPRTVPFPVLETSCHLMGTALEEYIYLQARSTVARAYQKGDITVDHLFEHLFPSFFKSLKAQIAKAVPARTMSIELEWLANMLDFLILAFKSIGMTVSRDGRPTSQDLPEDAVELPPNELPRLVGARVANKVPAMLARMCESAFSRQIYDLCALVTLAATVASERIRRNLAQALVPPLLVAKYRNTRVDDAVSGKRERLLTLPTRDLRTDGRALRFAGVRAGDDNLELGYVWESTTFELGARFAREGRIRVDGLDLSREIPASASLNNAAGQRVCAKCSVQTDSAERCSGCKLVYYCGVDCQRKDWPSHRAICRK